MAELTWYRGDTKLFEFTVYDENDNVFNLTGCKIWFTAKSAKNDADNAAIISLNSVTNPTSITISNPFTGFVEVNIPSTSTAGILAQQSLFYDIQILDALGRIFTVDTGTVTILEDITRSAT